MNDTISVNFPHKLLLTLAALQFGKLPICRELEGAAERTLVGALILHADAKGLGRPITISRKRLAELAGIGKSTLFEKLKNLKMMGILQICDVSNTISFTEHGVKLLACEAPERKKISIHEENANSGKCQKFGIFRKFGKFILPSAEACALIDRGVRVDAVAGLMRVCREAKTTLQEAIANIRVMAPNVLEKYRGGHLFAVLRHAIKNPTQYASVRKGGYTPTGVSLSKGQRTMLLLVQCGSVPLLAPGEVIRLDGKHITVSKPEVQGGAPMPITQAFLNELEARARLACEKAGVKKGTGWIEAFASLKHSDKETVLDALAATRSIEGKTFSVKGCDYEVLEVCGDQVVLATVQRGRRVVLTKMMHEVETAPGIVWHDEL